MIPLVRPMHSMLSTLWRWGNRSIVVIASKTSRRLPGAGGGPLVWERRLRTTDLEPILTDLEANVMSSTIASERFLCFTPNGRVEFFDLSRMNKDSLELAAPSRDAFVHVAESIVVELADLGVLDLGEVVLDAVSYGDVVAGVDNGDDPSASRSATVGARVTFHRTLDNFPVFRNLISIRLNQALEVVSAKLAWVDVEELSNDVPTQVTTVQAMQRFREEWAAAANPTVNTGFLAAGLFESQSWLEPWHVFLLESGRRPVDAVPAIEALAPLKAFGEVDMSGQSR